ncbi:unnamed protein product [Cylindrotheca closterium]|uniref:Uncharacterized protein n=1 Tax=Cylindrotheca closterium TaxID=2856 RepID=A0AAD2FXS7_9STRA|nr:unnamed protein product [Cylindrotheca closterium]
MNQTSPSPSPKKRCSTDIKLRIRALRQSGCCLDDNEEDEETNSSGQRTRQENQPVGQSPDLNTRSNLLTNHSGNKSYMDQLPLTPSIIVNDVVDEAQDPSSSSSSSSSSSNKIPSADITTAAAAAADGCFIPPSFTLGSVDSDEDKEQEDEHSLTGSSSTSSDDDDDILLSLDDFDLGIQQKPFLKWGSEAFVSVSIKQRVRTTAPAAITAITAADTTTDNDEASIQDTNDDELRQLANTHGIGQEEEEEHHQQIVQVTTADEMSLSSESSTEEEDDEVFIYRGRHRYEARRDPHTVRKVKVHKSVGTEIPNRAFQYCSLLTQVQLPKKGLLKIGIGAFEDCSQLQDIEIPSTVIEIKTNAFWSCRSLRHLVLPEGLQIVGIGAFAYCEFETVVYPSTLKEIGDGAFHWNSVLTTVYLKEGLKKIGKDAFSHCESLVNVNIPRTVKQISKGCFDGCGQLMSAELSPSLKNIGNYAFHMCDKLRLIYHENFLGNGAFFSCTDLYVPLNHHSVSRFVDECDDQTQNWNAFICHMVAKRFEDLPLHRLCYRQACESHSNQVTHPERISTRQAMMIPTYDDDDSIMDLVDPYGMTAFHILALSVRPNNVDLFQQLQKVYPRKALTMQDYWKTTPLEYLCLNRAPGTVEILQSMMEWGFESRILQFLGLVQWKQEVLFEMDGLLASFGTIPISERRGQLHQFLLKLLDHERLEALSLLECACWKAKLLEQQAAAAIMIETDGGATTDLISSSSVFDAGDERSFCRFRCGADVIIVNAMSFLGPVALPSTSASE